MQIFGQSEAEKHYARTHRKKGLKTMTTLSFQIAETVFSMFRQTPEEFIREMRLAAAVKWDTSDRLEGLLSDLSDDDFKDFSECCRNRRNGKG